MDETYTSWCAPKSTDHQPLAGARGSSQSVSESYHLQDLFLSPLEIPSTLSLSTMVFESLYSEMITTKKLTYDSKFRIWKSNIRFVLFDAGVEYVLTDPKPADPTPESTIDQIEAHRKWIKDDRKCRSLILFAMEHKLFDYFNRYETAKEMMDALTEQFISTSIPRRMLLFRKYTQHKMSENTPVMDHISAMSEMAVDLKEAGMPVPESMQTVVLMNSLPDSWSSTLRNIMHNYVGKDELTVYELIRHLKIEADYRKLDAEKDVGPSTKKQKTGKKGVKGNCYNCGKPGHYEADCPDED